MKVFSIRQPLASLVMMGLNITDTIRWDMKYRGRVLIHSSQIPMRHRDCVQSERFTMLHEYISDVRTLPYGCFLGVGTLVSVKPVLDIPMFMKSPERKLANYGEGGSYGLIFEDMLQFGVPIPAKGRLGFWEFEDYRVSSVLMDMCEELKGIITSVHESGLLELKVGKNKFFVDPWEKEACRWAVRDMLPNRNVRFEGHFDDGIFIANKMTEPRKLNKK